MVPDKEDAVQSHVSDMSPLPSERHETSITSEVRDIEAAVNEASNIVCNSGLDIGDIVVEHNKTEDEEERIAWFLEGETLCKLLAYYAPLSLQHRCSKRLVTSVDS